MVAPMMGPLFKLSGVLSTHVFRFPFWALRSECAIITVAAKADQISFAASWAAARPSIVVLCACALLC
jgi:hypothetical protein